MVEAPASGQTLYDRIGGEKVIDQLVTVFYDRVLADAELSGFFKNSPMRKLKLMQKEFFSTALDGQQTYVGLSLVKAHQGRGIKVKHFNLFAQHMLETLKEFKISDADIEAIISRLNLRVHEVTGDSLTSE